MTRKTSIRLLLGAGIVGLLLFWLYRRAGYAVFNVADLEKHYQLINELAETIIPETESPGAKKAKVAAYIIHIVGEGELRQEQLEFMRGLRQIESYCYRTHNRSFINCSTTEKQAVLTHFEEKAFFRSMILNKIRKKIFGRPFISQLKELTVEGYCTSMLGSTQGLAYDYIPGGFDGCTLLQSGQRSWALNQ